VAARRRAARDARGGDRRDPCATRRRVRDVPRQALHRRAGEAVRRAEGAAADRRRGQGGAGGQARRCEGRRDDDTTPDADLVKLFREAGGTGPIYGKIAGAFASSDDEARKLARERQPNSALGGELSTELALPRDFEAVAELVRDEDLEGSLVLGDDPASWRAKIEEFERAGFTHVALHHVGVEQRDFIEFAKQFV
jgi:hypothetical protein